MMALVAIVLIVLLSAAGNTMFSRSARQQIQEDAETDAFLDVLRQIRNEQAVPPDVAHVHRLAEQFTRDAAAGR